MLSVLRLVPLRLARAPAARLALAAALGVGLAVGGGREALAQRAPAVRAATPAAPRTVTGTRAPRSLLDDPAFRAEARRGLDALYAMRFAEARRTFDALAARHPHHPAGPFLQALVPWWQILNDLADTRRDEDFYRRMDEVVRRADARLRRSPRDLDAQFLKGAALAFRARLRANRRDYLRAARDGRAAMDYVLAVAERDTRRADFGFGRGIYDYYAAAVRADYPRLRPLLALFPAGSRRRGLAALERTFNRGDYLQAEAAYYLAHLYYVHEDDPDRALTYLRWLRTRYSGNAFFHAFEARVLAYAGRRQEAARAWRDVLARHDAGQTGYGVGVAEQATYFLARGALVRGEPTLALAFLQRLDRLSAGRESAFRTLGRLRQGMALDALGRRAQAVRRYREALALPDAQGAHAAARTYLERPYGQ